MSENTNQEPLISEEEIARRKGIMLKYYKDQIPLLKAQYETEKLMADIEEARARRLTMTVRIAQMMAGPQPEEDEDETVPPGPTDPATNLSAESAPRKLKTD